jgi:DNA/RNA endonuclease YhcR with UshA esterase domain
MNLKKISFIFALLGILLLLAISQSLPAKELKISDINEFQLNKVVKVKGLVFNQRNFQNENFQIISIKDETGKIDIITNDIINISNDDIILVQGKIKEFNGFLQIQSDKITLV